MAYVALQTSGEFLAWFPADITVSEPLQKSQGADGSPPPLLAPLSGIASSEAADADDDEIDQDGLDWSFALTKGIFTYEHPVDIARLAGYPESTKLVTLEKGTIATHISGQLYLNRPYGKLVYDTQTAMAAAGGRRSLGFSIEGQVVKGSRSGKRIRKAKVYSVAISPVPKNPDTWCDLAASMFARTSPTEKAARAAVSASKVDTSGTRLTLEQVTHRLVKEFQHLTWHQATRLAKSIMAG